MSRLFWGLILIVLGVLLIMRNIFNIDIPIFGTLISLLLIAWGISILTRSTQSSCCDAVFEEKEIKASKDAKKYDAVFGRGVFDLSNLKTEDKTKDVEINAVFGTSVVKIDTTAPIYIKATSAFGNVRMPNGNTAAFGDVIYTSESYKENEPHLRIKANAVFGNVEINSK